MAGCCSLSPSDLLDMAFPFLQRIDVSLGGKSNPSTQAGPLVAGGLLRHPHQGYPNEGIVPSSHRGVSQNGGSLFRMGLSLKL